LVKWPSSRHAHPSGSRTKGTHPWLSNHLSLTQLRMTLVSTTDNLSRHKETQMRLSIFHLMLIPYQISLNKYSKFQLFPSVSTSGQPNPHFHTLFWINSFLSLSEKIGDTQVISPPFPLSPPSTCFTPVPNLSHFCLRNQWIKNDRDSWHWKKLFSSTHFPYKSELQYFHL
jgi:hypothetical protein